MVELEHWHPDKGIKGKYYQRKQLFFDIAERHNKLVKRIKGWGAFRIHPSYFPTLKNSVVSLIKRGLVKGWCWNRRLSFELEETDFLASIEYLQLTQEGIETAKGL